MMGKREKGKVKSEKRKEKREKRSERLFSASVGSEWFDGWMGLEV